MTGRAKAAIVALIILWGFYGFTHPEGDAGIVFLAAALIVFGLAKTPKESRW